MNETDEMRVYLEKLDACLEEGNTAPLQLLLVKIVEWIEKQDKRSHIPYEAGKRLYDQGWNDALEQVQKNARMAAEILR